jgi:beta-glucosidase/6-phospho-beta-glucosidase/beta-galactosidase
VQGSFPPGVVLDTKRAFLYAAGEVNGHAKCFDAVHANDTADADGDGKPALVGPVAHQRVVEPADPSEPDDVAAADHVRYINNLWFLNAVVKGDVDVDVDGKMDGPNDRAGDPALVRRADWIGVNYYTAVLASAHSGIVLPSPVNAAITPDHLPTDRPKTDFVWDIVPTGLVTVLIEAKAYGLPMYVTENGLADASDANRPRFLAEHLYQLGVAIQTKGVDVRGYFHWSLYDNFEWANGFCPKFGLYAIDPATRARIARPSADLYRRLVLAGRVTRADVDATPAYTSPSVRCE